LVLLCHWPSRSMNRSRRCSVSREMGVSASAADLSAAIPGDVLPASELALPFLPDSPLPIAGDDRDDVLGRLTTRSVAACGEMACSRSSAASVKERWGAGLVSRETSPTQPRMSCAAPPGADRPPGCQAPPASFRRCGSPVPRSSAAPPSAWSGLRSTDRAPGCSRHP